MELERYRDLAFGTALAVLGDHHLAEDAVQDAFVEAIRSWDRIRNEEARGAWLRTIVRRRCYRLLRRRDLGQTDLPEIGVDAEPWRDAARNETHAGLLARVRALPRPLREVVVLHYLRGCPQREVAAFLDLPATTVNNRLHLARRLLKGRTMNFEIPEAGCVLRVDGPVADVRFSPDAQPDVFDALSPARAEPNLRVLQDLGDGVVRCAVVGGDAPAVGQDVLNRTASGGTYAAALPDDERLESIVATLGDDGAGFWETGIKSVDFLCPLPERGNVAMFGTAGTGKMALTVELRHRLPAQGPKLFYLADRSEPSLVRDLREEYESFDRDIAWILSDRATDPEFASTSEFTDASLYCSPLLAIRQLWPAVDPFHSRSRVVVSERHARLRTEALALLEQARPLTVDTVLLEYLACRAYGAARRRQEGAGARIAALPGEQRTMVERAQRFEAFMSSPFHTAPNFGDRPGKDVPLADTLDGVEAILSGACDGTPPDEFRYIGAIDK